MLSDLRFRVRALFRRADVEQELDDEIRFHLQQQAEKHIAAGVDRDEAMRRARLAFGGADRAREECRRSVACPGWSRRYRMWAMQRACCGTAADLRRLPSCRWRLG
jgi:hypothetical protein